MESDITDAERNEIFQGIQEKLTEPLEWRVHPNFRIIDLKESYYDEVTHVIKVQCNMTIIIYHHFFTSEPMCKASSLLSEPDSVKCYLDMIRVWMKDTTSIIAVSTSTGRVIGVAITQIISYHDKTDTYSRVQIYQGNALQKVMQLRSALINQARAFEQLNCESYLCIKILCVHPTYEDRGLSRNLIEICLRVAENLKVPGVVGIFSSCSSQLLTLNMGFRKLGEILYGRWVIDDEVIFDDPGTGNYSVALMGIMVEITDVETIDEKSKSQKELDWAKQYKTNNK